MGRVASAKWYLANKAKAIAASSRWKKNNLERVRAQERARYALNKDCHREKNAKYRRGNPEKVAAAVASWRARNRQRIRDYDNMRTRTHAPVVAAKRLRFRGNTRALVLVMFGGKCVRCGFSDSRALQLDHIRGCSVSVADRRKFGEGGTTLYRRLLRGDRNREDFQLLCANCNWIKRAENNEGWKNQKKG